ncbi:deoxynucleoside kinase [Clostridium butyricum]|uniref:deoxynucleoside kinase n=1 Tax=Clostridium butyricum TaxID=1492 RepID=UPI0002C9DEC9|nr:deoxynucleoside kinase [Clostridium butyricum]EMU52161.1 hypothetical protein CBDKU1_39110 [Clostridium butyricum DKU-01]
MNKTKIISISGGMCVGKTTLLDNLSKKTNNAQFFFENAHLNPYIDDANINPKSWCLHSRIAFLTQKIEAYQKITGDFQYHFFDRSFEEEMLIASFFNQVGYLNNRDFSVYKTLYSQIEKYIPTSDLVIYLYCPINIALDRLKRRNSQYESNFSEDNFNKLTQNYINWINTLPQNKVIRIDTGNNLDISDLVIDLIK